MKYCAANSRAVILSAICKHLNEPGPEVNLAECLIKGQLSRALSDCCTNLGCWRSSTTDDNLPGLRTQSPLNEHPYRKDASWVKLMKGTRVGADRDALALLEPNAG